VCNSRGSKFDESLGVVLEFGEVVFRLTHARRHTKLRLLELLLPLRGSAFAARIQLANPRAGQANFLYLTGPIVEVARIDFRGNHAHLFCGLNLVSHQGESRRNEQCRTCALLSHQPRRDKIYEALSPAGFLDHEQTRPSVDNGFNRLLLARPEGGIQLPRTFAKQFDCACLVVVHRGKDRLEVTDLLVRWQMLADGYKKSWGIKKARLSTGFLVL
jgi:hypothetical protein